jgi:MoaD family protein
LSERLFNIPEFPTSTQNRQGTQMTVSFHGAIRKITGIREEAVPGHPNVHGMLESLMERYGEPWRERVFNGRGLTQDVVVMVNGLNIQAIDGLSTPLVSGDRIDIFPMFEGG